MLSLAAGCVVSDPPTYGVTKQTPPFLDAISATPSIFGRLDLVAGQTKQFNVPVRSEDLGDPLFAVFWLDYGIKEAGIPKQQLLTFREIPPSTFEDAARFVTINWNYTVKAGCHAVSLIVTHKSNLGPDNEPTAVDDTAILTWWLNYDDDPSDPNVMTPTDQKPGCPQFGGTN
ncbi:MAG: hypothetical protein U0263_36145 [Polyangiaceae bacterium]